MCRGLGPKPRAAQGQEQKRAYRRSGDCDSYGTIESPMDADEHGFAHGTVGWATFSFPSPRPSPLGRGRILRRLRALPATEFVDPLSRGWMKRKLCRS